jgi:hypothetical protein
MSPVMASSAPVPTGVPRLVPTTDLRFDRRSPRLSDVPAAATEEEVVERLWRESALEGLAISIAAGGFFPNEPLIVEPDGEALVVVDGNRRLAAVRVLADDALRERLRPGELPPVEPGDVERLQRLPALVSQRDAVWRSFGYRHASGMQPWRSYDRARYVAWLHEHLEVPLDQVAGGLGHSGAAVHSLYEALRALRSAERAGVFDVADRWTSHLPFSLLLGALDRPGIREFLGLSGGGDDAVSDVRPDRLGELCAWLFGRQSAGREPVVRAHDPDLGLLERVVESPEGLAALRQGQPLAAANEAGRDGGQRFRESVMAARHHLREARGTVPATGAGHAELMRAVDDLVGLVQTIREELRRDDPPVHSS